MTLIALAFLSLFNLQTMNAAIPKSDLGPILTFPMPSAQDKEDRAILENGLRIEAQEERKTRKYQLRDHHIFQGTELPSGRERFRWMPYSATNDDDDDDDDDESQDNVIVSTSSYEEQDHKTLIAATPFVGSVAHHEEFETYSGPSFTKGRPVFDDNRKMRVKKDEVYGSRRRIVLSDQLLIKEHGIFFPFTTLLIRAPSIVVQLEHARIQGFLSGQNGLVDLINSKDKELVTLLKSIQTVNNFEFWANYNNMPPDEIAVCKNIYQVTKEFWRLYAHMLLRDCENAKLTHTYFPFLSKGTKVVLSTGIVAGAATAYYFKYVKGAH